MRYPDGIFAWHPQERSDAPSATRFKAIITTRNNYFVQYIQLDNAGGTDTSWEQTSVLLEHGDLTKTKHSQGNYEELLETLRVHSKSI